MAVIRCPKGHYYDEEKFSRCPHCGVFADLSSEKNKEKKRSEGDHTISLFGLKKRKKAEDQQQTVSLASYRKTPAADDQKTIGLSLPGSEGTFVTGWLVCTKGPERGRDWRLYQGYNRVGRNPSMDVDIARDPSVTPEGHCCIVYDSRANAFTLVSLGGSTVILNGEYLKEPTILKEGDCIGLGESILCFIPFCREGRKWEKQ